MNSRLEISQGILLRHLHEAAVEQLCRDLKSQGYSVTTEESFGRYRADVTARLGQETTVYEVKVGVLPADAIERIASIKEGIDKIGGIRFKLILVNEPGKKTISVEEIEATLQSHIEDDPPDELIGLASHQYIEEVSDVDISEIEVSKDGLIVKGDGMLTVKLQYGSDSDVRNDDGMIGNDTLPFEFECLLNHDLSIEDMKRLRIDTSSYYE